VHGIDSNDFSILRKQWASAHPFLNSIGIPNLESTSQNALGKQGNMAWQEQES
jgi:hypothetical protein